MSGCWVWLYSQEWFLVCVDIQWPYGVCGYTVTIWWVWIYSDHMVGVDIQWPYAWWVWIYSDHMHGGCGYTVTMCMVGVDIQWPYAWWVWLYSQCTGTQSTQLHGEGVFTCDCGCSNYSYTISMATPLLFGAHIGEIHCGAVSLLYSDCANRVGAVLLVIELSRETESYGIPFCIKLGPISVQ